MQDRYVGDVGDFAKFALLRHLTGRTGGQTARLGVVWCLFPDETHNNDGRHISYLRKPEFEGLDDVLLATLRYIVTSRNRCVAAVSREGVFPPGTVFYDAAARPPKSVRQFPGHRMRYRSSWLDRCLDATANCELVFFDPDNGLEVASVPKQHLNSGKYVYWDELASFWQRGQTLFVYHHLNRMKPASRQVHDLRDLFRTRLDGSKAMPLVFRRGSCRTFWLVYRSSALGTELERRAKNFLNGGWSKHFRPLDWPDDTQTTARSAS